MVTMNIILLGKGRASTSDLSKKLNEEIRKEDLGNSQFVINEYDLHPTQGFPAALIQTNWFVVSSSNRKEIRSIVERVMTQHGNFSTQWSEHPDSDRART